MPHLSLYLSEHEQAIVQDAAERIGVTQAYILRLVFRNQVGLPVGGSGISDLQYLTEIGGEYTRNLTGAR